MIYLDSDETGMKYRHLRSKFDIFDYWVIGKLRKAQLKYKSSYMK